MGLQTQNLSSMLARELDLGVMETVCVSSLMKSPLPKPRVLLGGASSSQSGGLLQNDNVVCQQSTSSDGPSVGYGNQGLSLDNQKYTSGDMVMGGPETVFRPSVSRQLQPLLPKPTLLPGYVASSYKDGGSVCHGNRPSLGFHQLLASDGPTARYGNKGLSLNQDCRNCTSDNMAIRPSVSRQPSPVLPRPEFLHVDDTSSQKGGSGSHGNQPSVVLKQLPPYDGPSAVHGSRVVGFSQSYFYQKKYLLLIIHARGCSADRGQCRSRYCDSMKDVLKHIEVCTLNQCPNPRCGQTKRLISHHRNCRSMKCPVCVDVHGYLQLNKRKPTDLSSSAVNTDQATVRTADCILAKRRKTEHSSALNSVSNEAVKTASKQPLKLIIKIPRNREAGKNEAVHACNRKVEAEFVTHPGLLKKGSDLAVAQAAETQFQKVNLPGISFLDFFTPEQIREHITSLRKWTGKRKANAAQKQAMKNSTNVCQLCAAGELYFESLPLFCNACSDRIPVNHTFYTMKTGAECQQLCSKCSKAAQRKTIKATGTAIPEANMEKKKNNDKSAERWVECGTCKAWQHEICALFNGRKDVGGLAEYTCPTCCIGQIERGDRKPLPQSSILGAKDLPSTLLSDHLEKRLFTRLKHERQQRAERQGKKPEDVPGAEGLVLRVVSSVDKFLKVSPNIMEIFQDGNYPEEFPYKSKAILLFQNIEGVEVCLFGMFVHEYGSECEGPNHRQVHLSYLDSVKYFRPEIAAVTGEALRTFVYHEILIGYLDYCKTRGFTSCYIWSCPPIPGDDYILYCHPEIQKMPKPDDLKNWYQSMIRKAVQEKIVVGCSNLHDHFFGTTGECKAKATATSLPYFDGDQWPRIAEKEISELRQGNDGKQKQRKMGKTKRDLKAAGLTDISGNDSMAYLVMKSIKESIARRKNDYIMVHLQYACSHCRQQMVSGNCWVCKGCRNFQLCDNCHDAEEKLDERYRHPSNSMDKHAFDRLEVRDVPVDTKDRDGILESKLFDTRYEFLGLCQGNHYQYDTLRRAKHSSMMLMYHLHNPTAPWFMPACMVCHNDVQSGQGWRCEICKDYDVCNTCFQKEGSFRHPHKLTNLQASTSDHQSRKSEARQKWAELRKKLALVAHAFECVIRNCSYPECGKVKNVFLHAKDCKIQATGGCPTCMSMLRILKIHARWCRKSECKVLCCKYLKEQLLKQNEVPPQKRRKLD